MFLVYEKNYLSYGDVDCIEERDMRLFISKENAIAYMQQKRDTYMAESKETDFTFMEDESNEICFVFADELSENGDDRSGEFHMCLVELKAND